MDKIANQNDAEIKDVSDIVGPFGLWQKTIFLVVAFIEAVAAVANLSSPILTPIVEFSCDLNKTYLDLIQSPEYSALKISDLNSAKNGCEFTINLNNQTHNSPCKKWEYSQDVFTNTFTEQWNLVCDNSWMIPFGSSVTLLGDLVACLLFGYLSDRIGRRRTLLIMLVPAVAAPLITLFSGGSTQYLIGRFLSGASGYGALIVSFILLMEIVGIEQRSFIGLMVKSGWTTGGIFIGAMAFWLRDSFYTQVSGTILTMLVVPAVMFLPESPRWLLCSKQDGAEEATKILAVGARWNRKEIVDIKKKVNALANSFLKEERTYNFLDLLRNNNMRLKTLILMSSWAVSLFLFYGTTLNSSAFSSQPMISFILICAIEYPANIFFYGAARLLGSKTAIVAGFIFTAIVSFGAAMAGIGKGWKAVIILALVKFGCTGCASVTYNFTAEVFPTVVRSLGMGAGSTAARLAALTSPFISEMAQKVGNSAVFGLFCVLSATAAVLVTFMPDTSKKPLLENLAEGESIGLVNPVAFLFSKKKQINVTTVE